MSKVQLQGNPSGTGVFTIASPNSNIDRTLTLPDNTGTLLTSATTDPALVFKRSNILGSVSQSGGVPTGAIIERGSNANGEFVKYADGTMICTTRTPNVNKAGGTFVLTDIARSYPAVFIVRPACVANQAEAHGDMNAGAPGITTNADGSASTSQFRLGYRVNNDSSYGLFAEIIAIGRWF